MLVAALLALLLFGACGTPEVQALRFNDAPWKNGEAHEYAATDMNGAEAGTLRFDLAQLDGERWSFRREIAAQGTQEIVVVEAGEPGFRPSASLLMRTDSGGTEQAKTTYDDGQVDIELTTKRNVVTYERVQIPSDARDQQTLMMLLRALPLAEGYAVRMSTFLPIAALLDSVTIEVEGQEEVETPAGTFTAWHVKLSTAANESEAWVGVDAPYPLVKLIDGRNGGTFELTEFTPGE